MIELNEGIGFATSSQQDSALPEGEFVPALGICLLYTSDAADD